MQKMLIHTNGIAFQMNCFGNSPILWGTVITNVFLFKWQRALGAFLNTINYILQFTWHLLSYNIQCLLKLCKTNFEHICKMELVQYQGSYTSFSQTWMAKYTLGNWAGYRRVFCIVRVSWHQKMSRIPYLDHPWYIVTTTHFPKPQELLPEHYVGLWVSKDTSSRLATSHMTLSPFCPITVCHSFTMPL